MTQKKPRKPLDDALARQFVYGNGTQVTEPESKEPQEQLVIDEKRKESDLMSKLQVPSKEPTVRFTVDLTEPMHRKLSILAAKTGRKKAEIVRLLLDEALKDVEE